MGSVSLYHHEGTAQAHLTDRAGYMQRLKKVVPQEEPEPLPYMCSRWGPGSSSAWAAEALMAVSPYLPSLLFQMEKPRFRLEHEVAQDPIAH